jgi:ABC-2 type transport system permease protein
MTGLLRAEGFKLIRRRMTWIMAILTGGLCLMIYLLIWVALASSDAAQMDAQAVADLERTIALDNVPAFGGNVVWQLAGIMAIILIASSIGQEYSWRTILTLATWTGDRTKIIAAKLIVATLLTLGYVVIGFLASTLGSLIVEGIRGDLGGETSNGLFVDIVLAAVRVAYALLPYVFLAGTLTLIGRSVALGIAVGVAMLFLEGLVPTVMNLLGDTFSWLKHVTMNWNVQGILAANGYVEGTGSPPDPELPSAWQAAAVLLLYIAAYVATMLLVINRRDITE